MKCSRAFTLTELLVVIGIIALLIAILLPVLARARRSSQQVVCAGQLREIGSLAGQWASEHVGFLPVDGEIGFGPDGSPGEGWPAAMQDTARRRYDYSTEYAGSTVPGPSTFLIGLFRQLGADEELLDTGDWADDVLPKFQPAEIAQCPAVDRSHLWATNSESGFVSSVLISMGERWAFGRHTTTDYCTNGGLLGFQQDQNRAHRAYRGQLSRVKGASSLALTGDGEGDFMSWTPAADRPGGRVTLADVLTGSDEMIHHGLRKLPQMDPLRHDGRANIAFVDGHVEAVPVGADALGNVALLQD